MMARFNPITEDEATNVYPKGEYDFEVQKCEEKAREKTGAPMFIVKLRVFNGNGSMIVTDCIGTDFGTFKLRHFCYGTGLGDKYEQGELYEEDFVGRTGVCKLIERNDPQYGPGNAVADYLEAESVASRSQRANELEPTPGATATNRQRRTQLVGSEDEIPF